MVNPINHLVKPPKQITKKGFYKRSPNDRFMGLGLPHNHRLVLIPVYIYIYKYIYISLSLSCPSQLPAGRKTEQKFQPLSPSPWREATGTQASAASQLWWDATKTRPIRWILTDIDGYQWIMDINGLYSNQLYIYIIYIHNLNQLPWDISNNDAYEWILPFPQCYIPPYLWSQSAYIPYYGPNMCKFPT